MAMSDDAAQPGLPRQDAPPQRGVPDYESHSVDSNDPHSDFFSAARPVALSLRDLMSAGIREVEILSCLLTAATQSQRAFQAVALAVQALHHMLSAGLFETELMSLLLPAVQPVIQSLRDLLSAGVHQVETLSCLLAAARREQQSQRSSQAIVLAVQALQKTLTAGLVETELIFLLLPAARQAGAATQTQSTRAPTCSRK